MNQYYKTVWTLEEIGFLQENHLKLKQKEICFYLKKSSYLVRTKLKELNLKSKVGCINEHYFNKINSEDKAYFLGLLYADGCLVKHANIVTLSLQEKDNYILNSFSKYLECNRMPKIYKIKTNLSRPNCQNQSRFQFNNTQLYNDLIKLGCFPQKTFNLKFPTFNQVPQKFIHHFIRGYFDGDGTISEGRSKRHKSSQFGWRVAGTYDMCSGINDIFVKLLGLRKQTIYKQKNIWIYSISGNLNIRKVFTWLYCDAQNFLTRKKEKLEKVFNCPMRGQTSKCVGVSWDNTLKKWLALKQKNNIKYYLGHFQKEQDAINAVILFNKSQK